MPWASVDVFLSICPSLLLHDQASSCEDETSGGMYSSVLCFTRMYLRIELTVEIDP